MIRVVHLVRDPRGYLHSHKTLNWFAPNHKIIPRREDINIMQRCQETVDSLKITTQKSEQPRTSRKSGKYPPKNNFRYTVLRYEDIAINPVKEGLRLARFLELKSENRIVSYFVNKTRKTKVRGDRSAFSTSSRDIMHVMNKWKYQADMKFIRKIEFACEKVMILLGYKVLEDEDDLSKMDASLIGEMEI